MTTRTPTIDSQVHAYERNSPERPWHGHLTGPEEVTGDDMVARDGCRRRGRRASRIAVLPCTATDASYALEVYANHPGKFGPDKALRPGVRHDRGRHGRVDRNSRRRRSAGSCSATARMRQTIRA